MQGVAARWRAMRSTCTLCLCQWSRPPPLPSSRSPSPLRWPPLAAGGPTPPALLPHAKVAPVSASAGPLPPGLARAGSRTGRCYGMCRQSVATASVFQPRARVEQGQPPRGSWVLPPPERRTCARAGGRREAPSVDNLLAPRVRTCGQQPVRPGIEGGLWGKAHMMRAWATIAAAQTRLPHFVELVTWSPTLLSQAPPRRRK